MSAYVITVTPDVSDEAEDVARGTAQAVVRVETAGPTPRITEMTIRSTTSGGLCAENLPSIDLESVVKALQAGVRSILNDSDAGARGAASGDVQTLDTAAGNATTASKDAAETSAPAGAPTPTDTADIRQVRVYRRMPDVDEVRAAFERIGTITGLAKHFGVPRHTAQGWMGRIRKMAD